MPTVVKPTVATAPIGDLQVSPQQPPSLALPTTTTSGLSGGKGTAGREDEGGAKTRQVQSCVSCRRRKIKCDRTYPCGQCAIRGEQDLCKPVETSGVPAGFYTPLSDHARLVDHVSSLEEQVRELRNALAHLSSNRQSRSSSPSSLRTSSPHHMHMMDQDQDDVHDEQRNRDKADGARVEPDEEDVPLMLEDLAVGFRQNRERLARQFTGGSSTVAALRLPSRTGPLAFLLGPDFDYVARGLAVLPSAHRTWQLVHFYFSSAQWMLRILHEPTYFAETRRLLALPAATASSQVRPEFLACHLMVICNSLHLMDADMAASFGWSPEEASETAVTCFSAAQAMLWSSDFLNNHTLEHLQAIMLMGTYQNNASDEADGHWSLLGSAIKIAVNLGMSRLGPEQQGKIWPEPWDSLVTREIGRRVWWNMVSLDHSFAEAHGVYYSIHPDQNRSAPPLNMDDETLERPNEQPKPLTEYTSMSFHLLKIRFINLYRELTDHLNLNSPASYPWILEMDIKILAVVDDFPSFFRNPATLPPSAALNMVRECTLLSIVADYWLVRLHRPYVLRGYVQRKYEASKDRCVQSARSILKVLKFAEGRVPILLRFWIVLYFGFSAAFVVFWDLTRLPSDETRTLLRETIEVFRLAGPVSDTARRSILLLEGLLHAEEEIRHAPHSLGVKRRRTGEDGERAEQPPFVSVVARLITAVSSPRADQSTSPSALATARPSPTATPYTFGNSTSGIGGDSTLFDALMNPSPMGLAHGASPANATGIPRLEGEGDDLNAFLSLSGVENFFEEYDFKSLMQGSFDPASLA